MLGGKLSDLIILSNFIPELNPLDYEKNDELPAFDSNDKLPEQ